MAGGVAWTVPALVSVAAAPAAAQSDLLGTGILYGADRGKGYFYTVDRDSGRFIDPGVDTGVRPREMTFHAGHGVLFGIDVAHRRSPPSFQQRLFEIEPDTGAWTPVGELGIADTDGSDAMEGLAYHPDHEMLYGCRKEAFYSIDINSGLATQRGSIVGTALSHAMAYDSRSDVLWGVDGEQDALWQVNPATFVWSFVGFLGMDNFRGLAHDEAHDVLYAANSEDDSLYTIDRESGEADRVGMSTSEDPIALAFVP